MYILLPVTLNSAYCNLCLRANKNKKAKAKAFLSSSSTSASISSHLRQGKEKERERAVTLRVKNVDDDDSGCNSDESKVAISWITRSLLLKVMLKVTQETVKSNERRRDQSK